MFEKGEINFENPAMEALAAAYLKRLNRTGKSSSAKAAEVDPSLASSVLMGPKLDDLADSVLQGVTYFRWMANRKTLREKGPAALLGHGDTGLRK